MKTPMCRLYHVIVVFIFAANFPQAFAADTNPPPRLTVELRDGSRVVGDSVNKNFEFQSALLGRIKLAVSDIRAIECVSSNSAKLSTTNGDSLTVSFVDSEFAVKTIFGKVELPIASLRHMTVTAGRRPGQARDGLVFFWSGTGDGGNNIGTDPDTLTSLSPSGTVKVSNSANLVSMQQTRQLTFEAWIKPNSIPREFPVILSKGGNTPGGPYGGYEFVLNAVGYDDLIFESGGCQIVTRNANGRWVNNHLGEWIFVGFTIDDRTKEFHFYVNGQPTMDEYNSGNGNDLNFDRTKGSHFYVNGQPAMNEYNSENSNDLNFDLPNNLYIGAPDPAAHPNRSRFDGEIHDVMLFNRVLPAEEIKADYEAGHPN